MCLINIIDAASILKVESLALCFPDVDARVARILIYYICYAGHLPRSQLGALNSISIVSNNDQEMEHLLSAMN